MPDLSAADVTTIVAGLALLWLVPGYVIWLRWPRPTAARTTARTPPVDIIVPTFNEAAFIAGKIANLRAVAYPADAVHVWIVDGASDDGTPEIAEGAIAGDPRFHLLRARTADKTHQLNVALRHVSGEWVVVSDADARLGADTLRAMIAAGLDEVAVVGAQVRPVTAHPVEQMHWHITNRLRIHESRRGGAAVAAPCYMFRRSLLRTFPDDVVADDIHVTFAAALGVARAVMIAGAVDELRTPQTVAALIGHKIRKSRAYIREILRFLPHVGRMRAPSSSILLWRAAHLSVVPVLVVLELALFSVRVGSSAMSVTTLGAAAAVLALVSALAGAQRAIRLLVAVTLTLVLTFSMLVALVGYPVMAQTASFPRLAPPRRRRRPEGAV